MLPDGNMYAGLASNNGECINKTHTDCENYKLRDCSHGSSANYYVAPNTVCPRCIRKMLEITCGCCGKKFTPSGPILYETRG